MKAQWRDKYLEICENTLQCPSGTVVKGALLSHLKLNVSPIVESSDNDNEAMKEDGEKGKFNRARKNSSLQRKRCIHEDRRSIESKRKSITYFQREIGEIPVYEELDLLTSDGYLIPEELKEKIRKARSESKQRLELDEYLKESGLPRRPDDDMKLMNDDKNTGGTYISITYRNSEKNIQISSDKIHPYFEVQPKPRPVSSMENDGEEESPYSVVNDFKERISYIPNDFLINKWCEHGIALNKCRECEHYYTEVEHSIRLGSECDIDNYSLSSSHGRRSSTTSFEEKVQDQIPETYLRQSVAAKNSDSTESSVSTKWVDGDDVFSEYTQDPLYYCLEATHTQSIQDTTQSTDNDENNNRESVTSTRMLTFL